MLTVKMKSLSHVGLFATPWTAGYQALPSMGFSRQEYWSGLPLPSPKESKNFIKDVIGIPGISYYKMKNVKQHLNGKINRLNSIG